MKSTFTKTSLLAISITAASIGLSAAVAAEEKSDALIAKQSATFLGGAIAGGAFGGPIGFIVGAAVGAYYAEELADADRVDSVALELNELHNTVAQKTIELNHVEAQLERQQIVQRQSLLALERALNVETLFATDQYELYAGDKHRLQQVAQALSEYPEVMIEIHGFADHRGNEDYNAELSQKRAEAVASALEEAGINPDRMVVVAGGEVIDLSHVADLSHHRKATVNIELLATGIAQN